MNEQAQLFISTLSTQEKRDIATLAILDHIFSEIDLAYPESNLSQTEFEDIVKLRREQISLVWQAHLNDWRIST